MKPIRIRVAARTTLTSLALDAPGCYSQWPYDGSEFPTGTALPAQFGTDKPIKVPGDRPEPKLYRTLVSDLAQA